MFDFAQKIDKNDQWMNKMLSKMFDFAQKIDKNDQWMNKMLSKFSKKKYISLKIYFSTLLNQQSKTFIYAVKRYNLIKKTIRTMMVTWNWKKISSCIFILHLINKLSI